MTHPKNVPGSAALAICESLLLALIDRKILPEHEVLGLLRDAADANGPVMDDPTVTAHHAAVQKLIIKIIKDRTYMGDP